MKPTPRTQPGEDRKQSILDAAERLFANKGFSAAGIDEIAREAGIPKSLIYYYFSGKDGILEELFQRFSDQTLEIKRELTAALLGDPKRNLSALMATALDFTREHGDIMRIMMMEALKPGSAGALLSFVDRNIEAGLEGFAQGGYPVPEGERRQELLVGAFFFCFMPAFTYDLFGDQWCAFNGLDPDEARRLFLEHFSRLYFAQLAPEIG